MRNIASYVKSANSEKALEKNLTGAKAREKIFNR